MRFQDSRASRAHWLAAPSAVVLTAACLAGCGAAHHSAPAAAQQATSTPVSATTPSAAPPSATPAVAVTTPSAGSTLATQQVGPNDITEVPSSGAGFAILDSVAPPSPSTITTYDQAGHQLAVITGGFTSDCGAADVLVPGTGGLIITELITQQPAEGIKAATYSLQLTAHSAATGATVWTAPVVHPVTAAQSCITGTGLGYGAGGPDLLNFGVTNDGKWGLYDNGSQRPEIINLSAGTTRADPAAQGTLGGYVVDACQSNDQLLVLNRLASPQTGALYGSSTTEADAYHVRPSCPRHASAPAVRDLDFSSPNDLELGASGLFFTGSVGTSPGTGLTSDGAGLLVDNASVNPSVTSIVRYSLPRMMPVWHRNGQYYMWGDGGGTLIISRSGIESGNPPLIGLNDSTGAQEWRIPGGGGSVCAVSSTQILYSVHGQLAVLDVKTGQQLSYSPNQYSGENQNDCPAVLPGGIIAQSSGGTVTVTQVIAP